MALVSLAKLVRLPALPALPAAVVVPALLVLPILWEGFCVMCVMPRHPPTHALIGDWFVHVESFPLFLLGYLLARSERFWQLAVQLRWLTLVAAVLAITAELGLRYLGMHMQPAQLPPALAALPWERLKHAARAAYTWLAPLTLLGWAKQRLNRPFGWLPYCTEAVFPDVPRPE